MKAILLFFSALSTLALAEYRQKLDVFSFDTKFGEYPRAYNQFGSSIGLKTKMKLIPKAAPTYGAIFLNQVYLIFCIIFSYSQCKQPLLRQYLMFKSTIKHKFRVISHKASLYGICITNPTSLVILGTSLVTRYHKSFNNFLQTIANGLGVFVYKGEETNKIWTIQAVVNNGIEAIHMDQIAHSLDVGRNGCQLRSFDSGKLHITFKVVA